MDKRGKMSDLREVKEKESSEFLVKVIDCSLKEIFGEHAVSIIYDYMEKKRSLSMEEIPQRIEDFRACLREFLSTGAYVVEKAILKKLSESHGLSFREEGPCRLDDYIREFKERIKGEFRS